ncbi:AraC family transcriptional regulator [Paracoccus sp. Z118]|uniref:helix-turn-helix domain-containing protein n=1 Tax=Paracoccus sp. Z118 TaxID=2851017 RepID=UPI001C2C29AF|nr:AraC family transcriptional regulator [Paracoccus sp. Z118]MBV0890479.1 AraC family transcriptional regulator [Paracoccus sp. Z118]
MLDPDPHIAARFGPHPTGAAEPDTPLVLTPANRTNGTAPLRPYTGRTAHVLDGLRVMPLGSFSWGGQGAVQLPRVRSDSVLMLIDAGAMRIDLPRGGQAFQPGQMIFVPAGSAFAAQPSADAGGAVLRMPAALTRDLAPGFPQHLLAGRPSAALRAEICAHVAAIQRDSGAPFASARLTAELRLRLLALLLQRADLFEREDAAAPALRHGDRSKQILQDFEALAGRELGRGRTLSDLAEAIGATMPDLDAACRTQRGQSALDILYELRLERATAMLRGGHDSLAEIASALGYTGVAHLNRAFVSATGRTPESFRSEREQTAEV